MVQVDHTQLPVPERRDLTLDLCACARDDGPAPVTAALLACPGVEAAHVDTYVTWALATFDATRTTPDSIVAHLATAGFTVQVTRVFEPERIIPAGPPPAPCPLPPSLPDQEQP